MGSTQDRHPIGQHTPTEGWYPDAQVAGQIRSFDGRSWTQHTAPAIRSQDVANAAPGPKKRRQTGLWIMLGVTAALVAVVFAVRVANLGPNDGGAGDTAAGQGPAVEAPAVAEEQAAESADEMPAEPEAPAASGLTVAQQNAVERAQGYLDMMGFPARTSSPSWSMRASPWRTPRSRSITLCRTGTPRPRRRRRVSSTSPRSPATPCSTRCCTRGSASLRRKPDSPPSARRQPPRIRTEVAGPRGRHQRVADRSSSPSDTARLWCKLPADA